MKENQDIKQPQAENNPQQKLENEESTEIVSEQVEPKPKKKKSGLLIVLIVLVSVLLVAIAACALFYFLFVSSVKIDSGEIVLCQNQSQELSMVANPSWHSDDKAQWASSDDKVCKVDNSGKITAIGPGKCIITVTLKGKSGSTEVIVNDEHPYQLTKYTAEPTCTEEGQALYTCDNCGETKTEAVPATDHKWAIKSTTPSEEACIVEYVCEYDATHTKNETTTHAWDDGVETAAPSCTSAGQKLFTCANCKGTYTIAVDKLGHDFGGDGKCTRCGQLVIVGTWRSDKVKAFYHDGRGYVTLSCNVKIVIKSNGTATRYNNDDGTSYSFSWVWKYDAYQGMYGIYDTSSDDPTYGWVWYENGTIYTPGEDHTYYWYRVSY